MNRRLVVAVFSPLIAMGALSGCNDDAASSSAALPTTVAPSSTAAPVSIAQAPAGSVTSTSVDPKNETSHLISVTAAADGKNDQVTFKFDAGLPGYSAGYVEEPVLSDGEGAPVPVSGDVVFQFVMANASGADLTNEYKVIYTGPKRFTPENVNLVSELVQTGDFGARLSWAIGLKNKAPYTVGADAANSSLTLRFSG